ncbi:ankyrin repeat domain-containing protein [candidate division KSB1 bacterium]
MRKTIFTLILFILNSPAQGQEIFNAVRSNNPDTVMKIIEERPGEIKITDRSKNTPLHYAAIQVNEDIVRILIENGADVNFKNSYKRTPYQKAIIFGNTGIADFLKSHGADTGEWKSPSREGKYFGQTPPGDIPEIFAPGIISMEYRAEWGFTLSPGGDEIYYTQRRRPDHGGRIWFLKFDGENWSEPRPAEFTYDTLDLFSMEAFEYEPHISPDGQKLLYGSKRPLPGQEELNSEFLYWIVNKEGSGWGEPYLLDSKINNLKPMFVSMTLYGTIYFTNTIENKIYRSEYKNGSYQIPERLPDEINFLGQAAHPFIAPDESYIIFDGRTEDNFEFPVYLYISFRKDDGSWTEAVKFDEEINSLNPALACVSRDGKYIFFESNTTGYGDIYWVDANVIEKMKKNFAK